MTKITGSFTDFSPVLSADIEDGKLLLGEGKAVLVVDSGFTGDISAPSDILNRLDLAYSGTMPFQLADESVVWKDLWAGKVAIGGYAYDALFIEGDFLLGMELGSAIFSYFLIDFVSAKVELAIQT